jgi:hypothetical protein
MIRLKDLFSRRKTPQLIRLNVVISPHELTRCKADEIVDVNEVRAFVQACARMNTDGPVPAVTVERVK